MPGEREFVGRWSGHVREGAEQDHDRFVDYLRSDDGRKLLGKVSLTEYSVYQKGRDLDVVFKSDRPMIIAGFLRNKRLWPGFWEFEQPGQVDEPADKDLVYRWTRE
jgi:hypothetical protein